MKYSLFLFCYIICFQFSLCGQTLKGLSVNQLQVSHLQTGDSNISFNYPLLSYELNGVKVLSSQPSKLKIKWMAGPPVGGVFHGNILFYNPTGDTIHLSNVVPFGTSADQVYITGLGNHRLSRTHLFRPGRSPVNVIVPDNIWELGYSGTTVDEKISLCALVRRNNESVVKGTGKRFETVILPGGEVKYDFYADIYQGVWQEGLRKIFHENYLFDTPSFDSSLFERNDLKWIRQAYVMHLMMAWDKDYYDSKTGQFHISDFIRRGKKLYGGDDVVCLWPTWPTLGIDNRNQFDMYRDLPGGLRQVRALADTARSMGVRFFIAYNPWDESTRKVGHLEGLASLIKETSADGVVLDTWGESSRELQAAADAVRKGVIMYSEGMAVPKDMQGIVAGRVHNALYYPPMLNLNKLIRSDFAIFRVAEVFKEPIQREYAVAFFNGYGTEINQFAPGHPSYEKTQYEYLGRTSRILRENTNLFTSGHFTPLVQTRHDSIWVNQWSNDQKKIYTIYSLKPEGFKGPLITVLPRTGFHFVDLWYHQELKVEKIGDTLWVAAETDAFDSKDLRTNNEGESDCIAELPAEIKFTLEGDWLTTSCRYKLKIWAGVPVYDKTAYEINPGSHKIKLSIVFPRYEGRIVMQAFDDNMVDEAIAMIQPGTARKISEVSKSMIEGKTDNMVLIPGGPFLFKPTHGDDFIPYPTEDVGKTVEMNSFLMDKFPVTNHQFQEFLNQSHYIAMDTSRFLKHWKNGKPGKGEENFPVTYISYEDAQAYARWAGKRLPSEQEWQYAAQTSKLREWPWNQKKKVTRKETYVTETLTVSALSGLESNVCNLGNGKLYPVGKYTKGANPYGLMDLTGSVWQLTNDVYESGSYRYIMMKGGSYFNPSSSWWYVQGGPRELSYRQYLLRVSEGFERNATVGFRCVKDH